MSTDGHSATDVSDAQWEVLQLLLPPPKWRPGGWERQCQGRLPEPSAGCADSQSIKTATQGKDVGFDGNKKVKGRKRHILVDTLGLIVAVVVTAANVDDRQGLVESLTRYFASGVQRLRKIWAMAAMTLSGCVTGSVGCSRPTR
jgi:hypothetical protein